MVWARDWRRLLFEALQAPGVPVVLSAVTPPGVGELPWDEWHCAHLGPHQHGARLGCRVDGEALAAWSQDISKRWKRLHNVARNACKRDIGRCLPLATRAWEPQARGPGHVHPVFHVYSAEDVRIVECYLAHLARLAPRHGFGFVGGKRGTSMQVMSGDRAAAYLSSYFVRGKGSKATLQENARNPHLPRMLIWASPTLTRSTGVTIRVWPRAEYRYLVARSEFASNSDLYEAVQRVGDQLRVADEDDRADRLDIALAGSTSGEILGDLRLEFGSFAADRINDALPRQTAAEIGRILRALDEAAS